MEGAVSIDNAPLSHRPLCPFCTKGDGRVFAVKFEGHTKTLSFCCDACQQRWVAEDLTHIELEGAAPARSARAGVY